MVFESNNWCFVLGSAPAEEGDVMIVDSDVEEQASSSSAAAAAGTTKRKHSDADARETPVKRPRTQAAVAADDDDIIELD